MSQPFKLKNQGKNYQDMMSESNQNMSDATDAQRKAKVDEQKASGETPNKFWAKAAGIAIKANKKRQAAIDQGDAQVAQGRQQAWSGGLS